MTPNSSPVPGPRAPSLRSFLASATVAAAAVAGGASFLTACGSSDSGKREGATSDKAAKKLLPAFVASSVAEPDIPATNGSAAGFTSKVDLDALATSVPDKLGTGAPLKIVVQLSPDLRSEVRSERVLTKPDALHLMEGSRFYKRLPAPSRPSGAGG